MKRIFPVLAALLLGLCHPAAAQTTNTVTILSLPNYTAVNTGSLNTSDVVYVIQAGQSTPDVYATLSSLRTFMQSGLVSTGSINSTALTALGHTPNASGGVLTFGAIGANVEAWSTNLDTLSAGDPFTAGSNVTISGTWPHLTIASTAGSVVSLGSNAAGILTLSSGVLNLANPVNGDSGLVQLDATGNIPAGLLGNYIGSTVQTYSTVLTTLAAGNPFTAGSGISLSGTWPALTLAINPAASITWTGTETFANATGSFTGTFTGPVNGVTLAGGGTLTVGSGGTLGSAAYQSTTAFQAPITLTTSGSGAATFSSGTLNIPTPSAGGVTSFNTRTGSVTLTAADVNALTGLMINTTGTATYATTAGNGGVTSFNTRTGSITLTAADVNATGTIDVLNTGTATSATALTTVNPVAMGGTSASTASAAASNLGAQALNGPDAIIINGIDSICFAPDNAQAYTPESWSAYEQYGELGNNSGVIFNQGMSGVTTGFAASHWYGNSGSDNTTTATFTSGSSTITLASASGFSSGQSILGQGLQYNTTITGLSGTTATLSLPTTAVSGTATTVISGSIPIDSLNSLYYPGYYLNGFLCTAYNASPVQGGYNFAAQLSYNNLGIPCFIDWLAGKNDQYPNTLSSSTLTTASGSATATFTASGSVTPGSLLYFSSLPYTGAKVLTVNGSSTTGATSGTLSMSANATASTGTSGGVVPCIPITIVTTSGSSTVTISSGTYSSIVNTNPIMCTPAFADSYSQPPPYIYSGGGTSTMVLYNPSTLQPWLATASGTYSAGVFQPITSYTAWTATYTSVITAAHAAGDTVANGGGFITDLIPPTGIGPAGFTTEQGTPPAETERLEMNAWLSSKAGGQDYVYDMSTRLGFPTWAQLNTDSASNSPPAAYGPDFLHLSPSAHRNIAQDKTSWFSQNVPSAFMGPYAFSGLAGINNSTIFVSGAKGVANKPVSEKYSLAVPYINVQAALAVYAPNSADNIYVSDPTPGQNGAMLETGTLTLPSGFAITFGPAVRNWQVGAGIVCGTGTYSITSSGATIDPTGGGVVALIGCTGTNTTLNFTNTNIYATGWAIEGYGAMYIYGSGTGAIYGTAGYYSTIYDGSSSGFTLNAPGYSIYNTGTAGYGNGCVYVACTASGDVVNVNIASLSYSSAANNNSVGGMILINCGGSGSTVTIGSITTAGAVPPFGLDDASNHNLILNVPGYWKDGGATGTYTAVGTYNITGSIQSTSTWTGSTGTVTGGQTLATSTDKRFLFNFNNYTGTFTYVPKVAPTGTLNLSVLTALTGVTGTYASGTLTIAGSSASGSGWAEGP